MLSLRLATCCLSLAGLTGLANAADTTTQPPNIIVVFADDMGYGDLACYGHPSIRTPSLDRMAREGMRFTKFYSAAEVCTPSRAGLLTGRLPPRTGMCSNKRRVLFPNSKGGLPASEVTIAELLKTRGYATGCVGKWHLGHLPEYLPMKHGFDEYFGLPYSNDMDRLPDSPKGRLAFLEPKTDYWNVPLLRGNEVVERPADQHTLTKRYTDEAIDFVKRHRQEPFFLYLCHSMPHIPLFASSEFAGKSRRGLYGDVIEELDANVGRLLQALRDEKLAERTLVLFTSDNGPWLTQSEQGGSAGLLKDGKGSTWEGGMREPAIAWWPGTVPAGEISNELGSTTDLLATAAALSGAELPQDRVLDSHDLSNVLRGSGPAVRDRVFYYRGFQLMAIRLGPWKAHFQTQPGYGPGGLEQHDPPLLFHVEHDPSERFNVAKDHGDVIQRILKIREEHLASMQPAESQLEK
jgi:arylsulfatase A-like enzyme